MDHSVSAGSKTAADPLHRKAVGVKADNLEEMCVCISCVLCFILFACYVFKCSFNVFGKEGGGKRGGTYKGATTINMRSVDRFKRIF